MDSREEGSDVSYPKIQFQIDSYSEVSAVCAGVK